MTPHPFTKQIFEHRVSFYDTEGFLIESVVDYIKEGLLKNETCLIIATPEHLDAFRRNLVSAGIDLDQCEREGLLSTLDAADTLSHFMDSDGSPNPTKFQEVVGCELSKALSRGYPVRAFGEMVVLLWKAGNEDGAIQLEKLWNELGVFRAFMLLCAYPSNILGNQESIDFERICGEHSHVVDNPETATA